MNRDLLIEIGCEELPTWAMGMILEHLRHEIPRFLAASDLSFTQFQALGTPRRIALLMDGLPEGQVERTEILTGPPRASAFDAQGNPTKAAIGFAAKCGVNVSALRVTKTAKGEYLAYEKTVPGMTAESLFAEALPGILGRIQFKKPMQWNESRYSFIRPIRWLLAVYGSKLWNIPLAGIVSGNTTHGHRMLGQRDIAVRSREEYLQALRSNSVILDPAERRRRISQALSEKAASLGGQLHPDDELLEEVTFLSEYPQVVSGGIPDEFLQLPGEVLMTVMRKHQKYFSVENGHGEILPHFLAVIDMDQDPLGIIRRGHERVLKARLKDAAFFWRVDTERKLESRLPLLEHYQFHVRLGSYREKTERIRILARRLLESLGRTDLVADMDVACRLSKADLATEMVKEFTELQGVMGGLYARHEGIPESVWQAVYEHYLPLNLGGESPRTLLGAVLSIADRADTLAGCFGIGMAPKGSSDPFALRRHAQGIVKIQWDHRIPLTLSQIMEPAFEGVSGRMTLSQEEARQELNGFMERRIRFMLQQRGFTYDVVNAVVSIGFDRPDQVLQRAAAVQRIRLEPDFTAITVAFKRVKNILSSKDKVDLPQLSESLLQEESELRLNRELQRVRPDVERHSLSGSYYDALKATATLRPAVDRFFDEVLVMSPNEQLRLNRLALLRDLSGLFLAVADIAEIVTEGSNQA